MAETWSVQGFGDHIVSLTQCFCSKSVGGPDSPLVVHESRMSLMSAALNHHRLFEVSASWVRKMSGHMKTHMKPWWWGGGKVKRARVCVCVCVFPCVIVRTWWFLHLMRTLLNFKGRFVVQAGRIRFGLMFGWVQLHKKVTEVWVWTVIPDLQHAERQADDQDEMSPVSNWIKVMFHVPVKHTG